MVLLPIAPSWPASLRLRHWLRTPQPILARPRLALLAIAASLALAACAPGASQPPTSSAPLGSGEAAASAPGRGRTLVLAGRAEIPSLASKPLRAFGLASSVTVRLFSAGLSLRDGSGQSLPYLGDTLPQLNSESWRVFPDGRMETTYRLRPNVTWHDGTPLSAHDWVCCSARSARWSGWTEHSSATRL